MLACLEMLVNTPYTKHRPIHKELGEDLVYFNVGLFSHFYSHDIVGLAVVDDYELAIAEEFLV